MSKVNPLLKKYMLGKIPKELVLRKKMGFPVPGYEFQDRFSKDFAFDILNSSKSFYVNFFNKSKVIKFFEDSIKQNNKNNIYFIWSIIVYELWYKSKS